MLRTLYQYLSGSVIPKSRNEETKLIENLYSSLKIPRNGPYNSTGGLAEFGVQSIFKEMGIQYIPEKQIKNWLDLGGKLLPDIYLPKEKTLIEIKSLRYFGPTNMSEKLYSIPEKYANFCHDNGLKLIIVLCGNHQFKGHGKLLLDAQKQLVNQKDPQNFREKRLHMIMRHDHWTFIQEYMSFDDMIFRKLLIGSRH